MKCDEDTADPLAAVTAEAQDVVVHAANAVHAAYAVYAGHVDPRKKINYHN